MNTQLRTQLSTCQSRPASLRLNGPEHLGQRQQAHQCPSGAPSVDHSPVHFNVGVIRKLVSGMGRLKKEVPPFSQSSQTGLATKPIAPVSVALHAEYMSPGKLIDESINLPFDKALVSTL